MLLNSLALKKKKKKFSSIFNYPFGISSCLKKTHDTTGLQAGKRNSFSSQKHYHVPRVDSTKNLLMAFFGNKFLQVQFILSLEVNKFQLLKQWFSNVILKLELFLLTLNGQEIKYEKEIKVKLVWLQPGYGCVEPCCLRPRLFPSPLVAPEGAWQNPQETGRLWTIIISESKSYFNNWADSLRKGMIIFLTKYLDGQLGIKGEIRRVWVGKKKFKNRAS